MRYYFFSSTGNCSEGITEDCPSGHAKWFTATSLVEKVQLDWQAKLSHVSTRHDVQPIYQISYLIWYVMLGFKFQTDQNLMLRIATWWYPDPMYRWPPDLLSYWSPVIGTSPPGLSRWDWALTRTYISWGCPSQHHSKVHQQRMINNGSHWLIMVNWWLIIIVDHFRETIHHQWYAWTALDSPLSYSIFGADQNHQRFSPVHLSVWLVTHINNRSWRYESFVARLFICTIRGMWTSQQFA